MTDSDISTTPAAGDRAFTLKSLLFGLLGIGLVAGLAGFHDNQLSLMPFVGNHLPVAAYFFLFLVVVGWNGVCERLAPALTLSTRELTVVFAMTLVACFPATSGLFRYFQRQVVLPWYYLNSGGKTEWERFGLLQHLSPSLFPQPAPVLQDGVLHLDDTVYRGYFTGIAQGRHFAPLPAVPWRAWIVPMLHWGPLFVALSVGVIGMVFLVHRQWARHEQLGYPVAQVAGAFLRREQGRGLPDVFRTRLFWWGFAPVFLLYMLEFLHQWFPESVPALTRVFPNLKDWAMPLQDKLPSLPKAGGWWFIVNSSISFAIIGLAYYVSSEISLTMGLSQIMFVALGLGYFAVAGEPLNDTDLSMSRVGAYIGYALILVFTGHTYYWAVIRRALGFSAGGTEVGREAVLAAWVTVLSFAAFTGILVMMGLDGLVAFCFALLLFLLFLVFTRIICETGIPFMQAGWMPGSVIVALFGPAAAGPGPIVMVLWLGTILCQDPRECLMPFAATGAKLADDAGIRLTRVFWALAGAVVVAMGVAFVATTWTQYNAGGMANDGWAGSGPPQHPFDGAARYISDLAETGQLDASSRLHGLAKLGALAADPGALRCVGLGLLAVVVFSLLRFRFAAFPLHAALFLVWGTYPAGKSWCSFLIGWAIKGLVVKFGGGKVYQQLKPVFVGLIAGELVAAGTGILVEMVYYWVTGTVPSIRFGILPA